MSVQLPEWYTKSQEYGHFMQGCYKVKVVDEETQHVQILNAGGSVKWDSKCKYCLGQMESDFYPRHENTSSFCGGQGRPHCTCPTCWG